MKYSISLVVLLLLLVACTAEPKTSVENQDLLNEAQERIIVLEEENNNLESEINTLQDGLDKKDKEIATVRELLTQQSAQEPLCEEGYTLLKRESSKSPDYYYCILHEQTWWDEFDVCETQNECPASYTCKSWSLSDYDYRCIPPDFSAPDLSMDCGCVPDGDCWCA